MNVYGKYVKEKADLEAEYARGLRKLVARYEPRKLQEGEETTEITSFRWELLLVTENILSTLSRTILLSVGYEAGQHELCAEHVKTEIMKDIQNKSEEIHMMIKDNTKHAKKEN